MQFKYQNPEQFFKYFCQQTKFVVEHDHKKQIKHFVNLRSSNDLGIGYWFDIIIADDFLKLRIFEEEDFEIVLNEYPLIQLSQDFKNESIAEITLEDEQITLIKEKFYSFFKANIKKNWFEEYFKYMAYEFEDDLSKTKHILPGYFQSIEYMTEFSKQDTLDYIFWLAKTYSSEMRFPPLFYFKYNNEFFGKWSVECDVAIFLDKVNRPTILENYLLIKTPWNWDNARTFESAIKQYISYNKEMLRITLVRSLWLWQQTKEEYGLIEELTFKDGNFVLELDTLTQGGELSSNVWTCRLDNNNPLDFFKAICEHLQDQAVYLNTQLRTQGKYSTNPITSLSQVDVVFKLLPSLKIDSMTPQECQKALLSSLQEENIKDLKHPEIGYIGFVNEKTDDLYVYLAKIKEYLLDQLKKARADKFSLSKDFWTDW